MAHRNDQPIPPSVCDSIDLSASNCGQIFEYTLPSSNIIADYVIADTMITGSAQYTAIKEF